MTVRDVATERKEPAKSTASRPGRPPDTAGFFAPAPEVRPMSTLRETLRNLPDAVYADLLESESAYLLVVDMPGVSERTIDLSVDGPRVRIEARREKEVPPEFRYLQEDRSLFMDVDLPVPPDGDARRAEASIDGGVLELEIPKRGRAGGTSIEIVDRSDVERIEEPTSDDQGDA